MRKTTKKIATMAVRKSQALELFFGGKNYRQISAELNCSVGTVHGDISAELKDLPKETREALQEQKRAEYTDLKMLLLPRVKKGDDSATALYLKTLAQESRCFGIEPVRTDSIGLQSNQTVIQVLPQYADLVRPLIELQEQR